MCFPAVSEEARIRDGQDYTMDSDVQTSSQVAAQGFPGQLQLNLDRPSPRYIHKSEKRFSCRICGNMFVNANNLRIHMRLHTGDRPYICVLCGKAFTQKTHLTTHVRTHTGEKPYTCDKCGKSFSQSSVLSRHALIHLNMQEEEQQQDKQNN